MSPQGHDFSSKHKGNEHSTTTGGDGLLAETHRAPSRAAAAEDRQPLHDCGGGRGADRPLRCLYAERHGCVDVGDCQRRGRHARRTGAADGRALRRGAVPRGGRRGAAAAGMAGHGAAVLNRHFAGRLSPRRQGKSRMRRDARLPRAHDRLSVREAADTFRDGLFPQADAKISTGMFATFPRNA